MRPIMSQMGTFFFNKEDWDEFAEAFNITDNPISYPCIFNSCPDDDNQFAYVFFHYPFEMERDFGTLDYIREELDRLGGLDQLEKEHDKIVSDLSPEEFAEYDSIKKIGIMTYEELEKHMNKKE